MSTHRSSYYEGVILDHIGDGAAYNPTGTLYLALLTAADAEPTIGANYARVVMTADTDWSAAAGTGDSLGRQIDNANVETFTQNNSGSSHGTMTQWAIYDAASGGNQLWKGPLDSSIVYDDGVAPEIAAGAVNVQLKRTGSAGTTDEGGTDAIFDSELANMIGRTTWTQPTMTMRLLTAITSVSAGTVTEVTVGQVPSYTSQNPAFGSPDAEGTTVTNGRAILNTAEVNFGSNDGAGNVSLVGWSLHDGTAHRYIFREALTWSQGATLRYPIGNLYLGAA